MRMCECLCVSVLVCLSVFLCCVCEDSFFSVKQSRKREIGSDTNNIFLNIQAS